MESRCQSSGAMSRGSGGRLAYRLAHLGPMEPCGSGYTRTAMRNEFTAVVERDGPWYIAYCPEIPGANGQGKTRDECLESLRAAIELILEDRREEGLKGVPEDAEKAIIVVG